MKRFALWISFAAVSVFLLGLAPASVVRADGLSQWTPHILNVTNDLLAVAYGGGRFAVVGAQGFIYSSIDGTSWASEDSPTAMTLNGVTHGAGIFVAVGDRGAIVTSAATGQWLPRNSGSSAELLGVTYGGGQFVAVGRQDLGYGYFGVILTSPDAVEWTSRDPGVPYPLRAVAFGGGTFMAVGHLSAAASANGVDWRSITVPSYSPVFGVVAGHGRFVSAQNDDYTPSYPFSVTEDLEVWRYGTAHTQGTAWAVTYGAGLFAAAGSMVLDYFDPTNQVAFSSNGQEWTPHATGLIADLRGIAYGAQRFVAVGLSGTIIQSGLVAPSHLELRRATDDHHVQLILVGEPGCVYHLQTATNLASAFWSNALELTNETGEVILTNLPATDQPHLFFRAVSQ